MSIRNFSLFIEVRDLSRYEGQLRNETRRGRKIQTLLEVKPPGDLPRIGPLAHLRGRPDSAPSQPGSPHTLVSSSSNPGVQIPALSPSDPAVSTP